jgi:hypothetical protein
MEATIGVQEMQAKSGTYADKETGESKNYTRHKIKATDGKNYITFDEKCSQKLAEAMRTKGSVTVFFTESSKEYEGKPYTERKITGVKDAIGPAPAAAPRANGHSNGNGNGNSMPPEYWEKKALLDFQRTARMSSLRTCAEIMSAAIEAKTEDLMFTQAMAIVRDEARKLYAAYFAPLEGGEPNGSSSDSDR